MEVTPWLYIKIVKITFLKIQIYLQIDLTTLRMLKIHRKRLTLAEYPIVTLVGSMWLRGCVLRPIDNEVI